MFIYYPNNIFYPFEPWTKWHGEMFGRHSLFYVDVQYAPRTEEPRKGRELKHEFIVLLDSFLREIGVLCVKVGSN